MIRKIICSSLFLFSLAVLSAAEVGRRSAVNEEISIIPEPMKMTVDGGSFTVSSTTAVKVAGGEDFAQAADYLVKRLSTVTGSDIKKGASSGNVIIIARAAELGDEAYTLTVSEKNIIIAAGSGRGAFWGIQSLLQLMPPEIYGDRMAQRIELTVPCVTIKDEPRFKWRGMHLDVGRHLFPVEFIKKYIDLLALHKLNTFHWHLTEDQGWRIEIKKYPKLTEIGSIRESRADPSKEYGGFYTQEEIKEVVAYAAERFITVVPEIELPGHSVAALASYPNLGCTGGPYHVRKRWGIAKDVYCAGNEQVYAFLEDVLAEVIELFPGTYVHIGGDECPKDRWKVCPKCQAKIKKEGLHNEHELQSYFIKRVETFLNKKGRRLIGWDEILEGGLAPGATVMSWRGTNGGIKSATMGHDVIMSPTSHCYFDYTYERLPLERVYSFNPVPESLPAEKQKHIIGAQGNVWTEGMPDGKRVEFMAFPRGCALAEVCWTPLERKDYASFQKRLAHHLTRLDAMDVNYSDPFPSQP